MLAKHRLMIRREDFWTVEAKLTMVGASWPKLLFGVFELLTVAGEFKSLQVTAVFVALSRGVTEQVTLL